MRKYLFILIVSVLFFACNDGDIIVTSFDFDDANLDNCGDPGAYVFFKINNETNESISLIVSTPDILFEKSETRVFVLDGSSNTVNYRKYDGEITSDYFCSSIPPTSPGVTSEFIAASGGATLETVAVLDDNDGIEETVDSELDTDDDGIPNYYDFDDDGDNVPTILELGSDFLIDPTLEPLDTDNDGISDYLDTDDDGDGVLTRYEDTNGDLDPTNDITDPNIGPDYLNANVSNSTIIDEYRPHTYHLNSDITLILSNLVLISGEEEITQETMNLGTKEDVLNMDVTLTPEF